MENSERTDALVLSQTKAKGVAGSGKHKHRN